MTGGTIVILGSFGYNLGAGMTGGDAYVYDPHHLLGSRLNPQLVDAARLDDEQAAGLRYVVERHRELTGSARSAQLLEDWDATRRAFRRVAPVGEVARIERANEGVLSATR
jgi:glutamate synthase domain-containing protein 3